MPSQSKRAGSSSRQWPYRALGLFFIIIVIIYALIFATGDRSAKPKLGIDLQGGTRVTLVPQGEDPTDDQLQQARTILENRVNGMGVSGASVVVDGNTLVVTVAGDDAAEAQALAQTSQLAFRPVGQLTTPDTSAVAKVAVDMADRWVDVGVLTKDQAQESLDNIETALTTLAESTAESTGAAAADVPDLKVSADEPEEPRNSIETAQRRSEIVDVLKADRQSTDPTEQYAASALLVCEARSEDGTEQSDPLQGADDLSLPLVTCDPASGTVYLLDPAPLLIGEDEDGQRLTGDQIDTNAQIYGGLNADDGEMEISFSFKSGDGEEGSATWSQLTQEHLNDQIAITLDSQILSAPVIQAATPVGSGTRITGDFSQQEAQQMANNLRYGALPLSFVGEDGESGGTVTNVPASLGTASLQAGLIAGLVGLILVAIYALVNYRYFGLISLLSLIASGFLVYGSLVLLGRWIGYSLDLAGIAGLIIGIGTTADSFVVLYERIKDEVREGRSFRSAVPRGWHRAKSTIITGNAVTLIGAVIIYFLAVGEVKGFAFTLGITTVFDILVTFLVTAPLVILASRRPWTAKPSANGFGRVYAMVERREQAKAESAAAEPASADHGKVSISGNLTVKDTNSPAVESRSKLVAENKHTIATVSGEDTEQANGDDNDGEQNNG
ncbi:MAG: protein translocase subunit SecD [Corynebacterium sp.]|nr:protein translocase subunit SecD [Corynebacterium sp.]